MNSAVLDQTRNGQLFAWGLVFLVLGAVAFVGGPALIFTFYVTQGEAPLAGIGSWNIVIGLFTWVAALVFLGLGGLLVLLSRRR
ncbi:hypothetical protein LQ757_00035 [Agromyces sp. SYSU K20354]|uniref:hypothetical protein n=1 Tax=Agromyces cavernae TaxID=2898659 RepID=UPI001E2CFAF3|nr:hypothetical protein [Agromyces cavernae]MCD2440656.1 hypothetical protein [Agromyces cavernae]